MRTDTPAMKAALDALCHLHPSDQEEKKGNFVAGSALLSSSTAVVDSRSVRVAIEQDALQQALLLQQELQSLVSTVQELRTGVSEVAAVANRVQEAIHTNVITSETETTMLPRQSAHSETEGGSDEATAGAGLQENGMLSLPPTENTKSAAVSTDENALEQEQKLASLLSDAFLHRGLARKRLETVHAFLEKFDLSQEDSRLLDHYAFEDVDLATTGGVELFMDTDVPNGMAFLNALERVRKIRQALTETFGATGDFAGLEPRDSLTKDVDRRGLGASSALRMMENLAQKQERAYERLYHWLQKYLQAPISGSANDSIEQDGLDEALQHHFVKRALYTLRYVPAFYSHTLELVASSRRAEVTRRFLLALTSGYQGFAPIEMNAHDSVVYVGDMLAFCFKALSVEADVARGLIHYRPDDVSSTQQQAKGVSKNEDKENGVADEDSSEFVTTEKPMLSYDMLSISMSGLSRPIKSRILQVLSTLSRRPDDDGQEANDLGDTMMTNSDFDEEGTVVRNRISQLYEIAGLLLFYVAAMKKAIKKLEDVDQSRLKSQDTGTDAVPAELNPIVASLLECLLENTKAYEATIRVYGAMLGQLAGLTGNSEASLVHSMLALIADIRTSSPGFSAEVYCPDEVRTTLSIEWVTEVLIEAALPTSKTLDDTVALKNSIAASKKAGMNVLASERLDETIDRKEIFLIEELVALETNKVLGLCGLGSLVSAWEHWQEIQSDGTLMVSYLGLSPEEVEAAIKEFYSSLFSPPLPSLETVIKDPALRKLTRSKIAQNVCDKYAKLYACITSSGKGGYEDVSFLGHTPEQVNTLLSA